MILLSYHDSIFNILQNFYMFIFSKWSHLTPEFDPISGSAADATDKRSNLQLPAAILHNCSSSPQLQQFTSETAAIHCNW